MKPTKTTQNPWLSSNTAKPKGCTSPEKKHLSWDSGKLRGMTHRYQRSCRPGCCPPPRPGLMGAARDESHSIQEFHGILRPSRMLPHVHLLNLILIFLVPKPTSETWKEILKKQKQKQKHYFSPGKLTQYNATGVRTLSKCHLCTFILIKLPNKGNRKVTILPNMNQLPFRQMKTC